MAALAVAALAVAAAPAAAGAQKRLCTEALVRTSDGVGLHAWISRPAPDVRRPVLLMIDSYARSGRAGAKPAPDNGCPEVLPDDYVPAYLSAELVARFTLVQVSLRGTGASGGTFDLLGRRSQRDVREAIAWAAALPQSTGNVVLVGESGTAFAAHHGLREPAVRAAVLFTSCADLYRCFRRGGTYNALADVYLASTRLGVVGGLRAATRLGTLRPARGLAAIEAAGLQAKARATDGPWWRERSALRRLRRTRVPVLFTTDPYDIVQPFDAFAATPGARLNLGMGHAAEPVAAAGGEAYRRAIREPVDRFVSHYGLGEDNGAEHDPRVTLATTTGGRASWNDGAVLARAEQEWPVPGTRFESWPLAPGGRAAVLPGARPDLRATAFALGTAPAPDLGLGGVTWTTAPLRRDLELTGPLVLRLRARSTARDFDLAVRLLDVDADGGAEWLTDGALRASLRRVDPRRSQRDGAGEIIDPWHPMDRRQPVPGGVPVRYLVELVPSSAVVRAGHRLRLTVSAAGAGLDSPRTLGAGTVDVLPGSSLLLPVVPGRCQDGVALTAATPAVRCAASLREALG